MCYYTIRLRGKTKRSHPGSKSDYVSKYRSPSTKRKAVLTARDGFAFLGLFAFSVLLHIGAVYAKINNEVANVLIS